MSVTEQQKAYHLRKMRTRVHRMDTNHDGYISVEDFELMAQNLVENSSGITKEKTDEIFGTLLKVADHYLGLKPGIKIGLEEAAQTASNAALSDDKEKFSAHNMIFDCIDTNNDGHISLKEFEVYYKSIGHQMTPEEIKHSFNIIDSNGDGQISREEFATAAREFFFGVEENELSNVLYGKLLP